MTKVSAKQAQYEEFYSVQYQFDINIELLSTDQVPTFEQFNERMPLPFKLASDIVSIDNATLRPLGQIDAVATALVDYLNHQSKKIDLLLGFILKQQDNHSHRYKALSFGGGGISFTSKNAFNDGQLVELKIFLPDENVAIFAIAEIFSSQENDGEFTNKLIYHHIRDDDRELLVKTSLHQQSKQLQSLAKQRRRDSEI